MRLLTVLIATLSLWGCKHMDHADRESQVDSYDSVAKLPDIACQGGELMSFHLEEQGLEPKADALRFLSGQPEDDYTFVKPSRDLNVRLDVCMNAKEPLQLRRVVYLARPDRPALVITPNRFSQVNGLDQALFQDDHGSVWVEIRHGARQEGYLMRGWKKGKESYVTFAAVKRHAEGQVVPKEAELLYGKLVYGDPWR